MNQKSYLGFSARKWLNSLVLLFISLTSYNASAWCYQCPDVWALKEDGSIYKWVDTLSFTGFEQVPGSLMQISAASKYNVWGVNAINQIFRRNYDQWEYVPSPPGATINKVSVGISGEVWALSTDHQIYKAALPFNPSAIQWTQIPGALVDISVGSDGRPWGVNGNQQIYEYDSSGNWIHRPGYAVNISVGDPDFVWVANGLMNLYRWYGYYWDYVPGIISQVDVGYNDEVWGVDENGDLWFFNLPYTYWTKMGSGFKSVSVALHYQ